MANIPATATSLHTGSGNDESKLPDGALMTNTDAGQRGFMGPCPPPGEPPHYQFTIKGPTPPGPCLGFMSNAAKLGEAKLKVIGQR